MAAEREAAAEAQEKLDAAGGGDGRARHVVDVDQGLSAVDVEARVAAGLVNEGPPSSGRTLTQILRANVLTRFNAILGALLVIILVVGPLQDALFGLVLAINTGIGVFQELRARRTLERLAVLTAPSAHLVRSGRLHEAPVGEIVVDDVLELRPGDQVPVDGTVLLAQGLEVDESLLSGEAEPVAKGEGDGVLSGSFVVAGSGRVRATSVGAGSYAGGLEAQSRRFHLIRSELQDGTNQILRLVTWVMVPTGVALAASQAIRTSQSAADAVRGSVAGVTAMVPEGLVLLTSIAFAVGALRLSKRRVLVQELPAVEGLARVDVVCIDKTGTLTAPGMHLETIEVVGAVTEDEVRQALGATVAADPAPNATIQALAQTAPPKEPWVVDSAVPFSSARKWSAVAVAGRGTWYLGAPDILLGAHHHEVTERSSELAGAGRRVVLLARASEPARPTLPERLEPAALLVLSEHLRQDAASTVRYLLEQGITIKVLSGDAPETVGRIAQETGIPSSAALDAASLADDDALEEALRSTNVFGRVRPEQKLAAVEALHADGHVVAMVGDGVNDVRALKHADIGIAMGSGSQASRAVARVVLLDSAFAAVPGILAEGRRVIANIERVANLFVPKTAYAALLALAVAVSAVPYPFFPRHLTVVSSLTIGVPGFFLALAPGAPRAQPGFVRHVLTFSVPAGLAAAVATYATYAIARAAPGTTPTEQRTAATLALCVVGFWILLLVARPLNPWRAGLVGAMAVALALLLAIPYARGVFDLALPPPPVLLEGAATTAACIAALTLWRWLAPRWRMSRRAATP